MRYIKAVVMILICVYFCSDIIYSGTVYVYGSDGEFFESNPNMKIGLIYGSGAVTSFQTSSETGFLLGYVGRNSSDKFNVLFYTDSRKILVSHAGNNILRVVNPDTGDIILEYEDGENNFAAAAAAESNKNLSAGDAIYELSSENAGFITTPANNLNTGAFIYRPAGSGIEVINLISLEDYIKGVLPYEISPSWPEESQKAFSVAVRSYSLRSAGRHADAGFMLCNSTHCQFYAGARRATAASDSAVDSTKDLAAVYNNQIIESVYHSSSGGVTENHNDAWGGQMRLPYLSSVKVPLEKYDTPGRNNSLWTNRVSPSALFAYLTGESGQASRFRGRLDSDIASIVITERSPSSNYIKGVRVTDINGNSVGIQNSDTVRSAFSKYANSANMDIYKDSKFRSFMISGSNNIINRDIESGVTHILTANGLTVSTPGDGKLHILTGNGRYSVSAYSSGSDFIFDGRGWGHGVGLSQWGMYDMALAGLKYQDILKAFYTGISIEKITEIRK
ncbi:MAG: SpoIID/LytB domain-containing protein [Oscillospiraceae bacterium]|nr:SpoIID/LytB domain-containing protein [Oscillospiraceae bacterium]